MIPSALAHVLIATGYVSSLLAGDVSKDVPRSLSGLLRSSQFGDADWGARLGACIEALPPDGGVCDTRELSGVQSMNQPLTISKSHVRILLGAVSVRMGSGADLNVTGSDVSLIGIGKQATSLVVPSTAGVHIGGSAGVTRKWLLQGLGIVAGSGEHPKAGIQLVNAREGRLESVLIAGFSGEGASGIVVGPDCWTVLLDDVNVASNTTGILVRGSNFNAWVIRSSLIVSNGVGILFDSHEGTGQGLSVVDGTHFEGNQVAGILFRSGDFQQVAVTNAYVETYAGQTFVLMRGTGQIPIRVRSFHFTAGHLFTADRSPFTFDASQGSADIVNAVLEQVHNRTSTPGSPVAVFRGARAKGVVLGAVVVDSKEGYVRGISLVKNLDGASAVTVAQSAAGPVLQLPTGIEIGGGDSASTPILAHSSFIVDLSFAEWTPLKCQDRSVRIPGARERDTVALGLPAVLATQPGLQMTAFVSQLDQVTVRGCNTSTGSSPPLPGPLSVRIDLWRH